MLRHPQVGREHCHQQAHQPPRSRAAATGNQHTEPTGDLCCAAQQHNLMVRGQIAGHHALIGSRGGEVGRSGHDVQRAHQYPARSHSNTLVEMKNRRLEFSRLF